MARLAALTALLLASLLTTSALAFELDCRWWTRMSDGKWAPTRTITIESEGQRWVLGGHTTLLPDRSAVIDLSAALDQQCTMRDDSQGGALRARE